MASSVSSYDYENALRVSDSASLSDAIYQLSGSGGGTILVEASDEAYLLENWNYGTADGIINIVAADPEDPPLFGGLTLRGAQNLNFDGLLFDTTQTHPGGTLSFSISHESSNITIRNSTFLSAADDLYEEDGDMGVGSSLGKVRDSEGFHFIDNVVDGYFHALSLNNMTDTTISGNTFQHLQGDSLRMVGVVDTYITGNTFADFYGSTFSVNHDDMIQLWSTETSQQSRNLYILDNIFNAGEGSATQTIFLKNEYAAYGGEDYENFVIENNIIYNGHTHGITVYDTVGVSISNNTVLWNPQVGITSVSGGTPVSSSPTINVYDSDDVVVTDNVTPSVSVDDDSTNVTSSGNYTLHYTSTVASNYIGTHIMNITEGGSALLADLMFMPDSSLSGSIGSSLGVWGGETETILLAVRQTAMVGENQTVQYDATLSYGPEGALDPETTVYTWSFADGVVLTGSVVERQFPEGGQTTVELSVTSGDLSASRTVYTKVNHNVIFDFNFDGGVVNTGPEEIDFGVDAATDTLTDGVTGEAFRLDGSSDIYIDRFEDAITSLECFTLSMSLRRFNPDDDGGNIVHQRGGVSVLLDDDGYLRLSVETNYGLFAASSSQPLLQDADWHRIVATYDLREERIVLYVDGEEVASAYATGSVNTSQGYPMYLGGPVYAPSLTGAVDDFLMTRAVSNATDVAADYTLFTSSLQPLGAETAQVTIDGVGADVISDGYRDFGTVESTADDDGLILYRNAWKVVDLPVVVDMDTVLYFTYEADSLAEIQGIGFYTETNGATENYTFQLAGTQAWGLESQLWSYDSSEGEKTFAINVGQYFTGAFDGLVLISDDDAGSDITSVFRDISFVSASNSGSGAGQSTTSDGTELVVSDILRTVVGYLSDQDYGSFALTEDGTAITLQGNAWKFVEVGFTVGAGTILSFDLSVDQMAEIHGIGIITDADSLELVSEDLAFNLGGSQSWGIEDYRYDGSGTQHFEIALGDYYTGYIDGLVLISDDDAGVGSESVFANIELAPSGDTVPVDSGEVEGLEINGDYLTVSAYLSDQDYGVYVLSDDGTEIALQGNAWKFVEMAFTVGADTTLSFDFASDMMSEIHGIGIVTADGRTELLSEDLAFNLGGSQSWGIEDYRYDGSGTQHFEIALGDYYTGDIEGLVLISDDDAGVGSESVFSNIELSPPAPEPMNFVDEFVLTSYTAGGGQDAGGATVSADGEAVSLQGNAWKYIAAAQEITADTVLSFDFTGGLLGEIHGIGLIVDAGSEELIAEELAFNLIGTQDWGTADYRYGGGGATQHFEIALGDYYIGAIDGIVLINDDDAEIGASSTFDNIAIA